MPPQAYFVGSAVFHYLGPAFAVLLFARVDVLGVAWLRIAAAAAVFALWRRPWRRSAGSTCAAAGCCSPGAPCWRLMNCCFYVAIDRPAARHGGGDRVPAGDRARGARRADARNVAALLLAVPGVYLLTDVRLEGEPLGVALAFLNAALFALYIVLGHRVAQRGAAGGIDGLAASMLVAAVAVTPAAGWAAAPAFADPVALLAGARRHLLVGDPLRLRPARDGAADTGRVCADGGAAPATATVIGVAVLGQVPRGWRSPATLVVAGVRCIGSLST